MDEVKKRFCIGSSRLYKIWRDETADRVKRKALPPADRVTRAADHVTENALPPPTSLRRRTAASYPTEKSRQSKTSTISRRASRLLLEVMAQLVHNTELEEERDELEEEREEDREEREEEREEEIRMDTAQKWAYISIAAILVWKIVGATWKQCAPSVQEQTAAPRTKRDPFYME